MTTVDETTSFLSEKTLTTIIVELTKKARSLEKENGELLARVNKLEEENDEMKEVMKEIKEDKQDALCMIDSLKSEYRAKESEMETKIADLQTKVTAKSLFASSAFGGSTVNKYLE